RAVGARGARSASGGDRRDAVLRGAHDRRDRGGAPHLDGDREARMDDGQIVAAPEDDRLAVRITDPATWEKAKDVIADALKRPAAERGAYVRERCPDPVLRAE